MAATHEELDWLANRWQRFRDTVRVVVMRHYDPLIAAIVEHGSIDDHRWNEFVNAVLRDLDRGRIRNEQLYSVALSLFADPTPLRRALEEVGSALVGEQAPAARVVAIKRGITRMRDAWIGGTEHRGKTWGRLDSVSRELVRATGSLGDNRCTMEHFIDLLAHLRLHHASDRNLPRKIATIEEYFYEFCSDCQAVAIDGLPEPSVSASQGDAVPGDEEVSAQLGICLEELEDEPRRFVSVHFKMTDPVEFSSSGYCQRMGIDRRRFHRIVDQALEALRGCIERSLGDEVGAIA